MGLTWVQFMGESVTHEGPSVIRRARVPRLAMVLAITFQSHHGQCSDAATPRDLRTRIVYVQLLFPEGGWLVWNRVLAT